MARLARSTFLWADPNGETSSYSSHLLPEEPPRYSVTPYSGKSSANRLTRRPVGPYNSTADVVLDVASSVWDQTMIARSVVGAASSDELVTNAGSDGMASIVS